MAKAPATSEISLTSREFRNTMGLFATGVTVITLGHGEDVRAMTANAVTSLSLDPLLLICCIDKQANCAPYFQLGEKFCMSILTRQQEALSNYFAGIWPDDDPPPSFELVRWQDSARLAGSAAAIECEVRELLEGGDHWIVIGLVTGLWRSNNPLNPLIFFQGRYSQLSAQGSAEI